MSTTSLPHRFPSAIEGKLRAVRWRHALLALAFALFFSSGLLMILMFTAMSIDWLVPFAAPWLRILMTSVTVTAAIATACWLGIGPVRRALHWGRAASAVDGGVPQLEERWSTVASLSKTQLSQMSPMQRAMAEQVTSEAIAMERIVVPHRVTSSVSLRPAIVIALTGVGLLLVIFAISPQQASVLLRRFWAPTFDITATRLTSVTGDKFVPRGDSIELVTKLDGLPRASAMLTLLDAEGVTREIRLRPDDESSEKFIHAIQVDDSLSYRVRSGDGQTSWHHLQVIDFPEIAEVQFAIDFPEYTQRESVVRDRLPRRVKVIQGSMLRLALKTVQPVKQFSITLSDPESSTVTSVANPAEGTKSDAEEKATGHTEFVHELQPDSDGWYRFEMQLVDDVMLQLSLVSQHELKNQHRLFSRIDVIADQAPVARVLTPKDELAVAEDETIEIEFEAHDDHGIATAELVVFDESQKDAEGNAKILQVTQIPLGDQAMQKHLMGKTRLDLKDLGVTEGREISYAIRVTDNRNVQLANDALASPNVAYAQQKSQPDSESLAENPTKETESKDDKKSELGEAKEGGNNSSKDTDPSRMAKSDNTTPTGSSPTSKASEIHTARADTQSQEGEEANREGDRLNKMAQLVPNSSKNSTDGPSSNGPSSNQANKDSSKQSDADDTDRPRDLASSKRAETKDPNQEDSPSSLNQQSPSSEMLAEKDAKSSGDPNASQSDEKNANKAAANDLKTNADPSKSDPKQPAESASAAMAKNEEPTADQTSPGRESNPAEESLSQAPRNPKSSNDNQPRPQSNAKQNGSSQTASAMTNATRPQPNESMSPPNSEPMKLSGQRNRQGQNTLTGRRRLKITDKLSSIAAAEDRPGEDRDLRETVVELDRMLAEIETGLQKLVERTIADADRGEQFRRLDTGLANVETFVAKLREQTKENQFAFVGLQMVDITRTHVTPARDRVFAGSQRPGASDVDAKMALQHIVRARELLDALLKRYDRVKQEKKLEEKMDEAVTMYEVYLEKRRSLMREARQNLNPLERKMGIIKVDQAYLDRLAEVLALRRDMMDEFAQMLGDDPRLLSRYMELIKRRQSSLRDQLTEISQRQYDMTEEAMNWLQIDKSQRQDLWTIIIDLRLAAADDLAKDAAELAERIEKQMPLEVAVDVGTPAEIIRQAKQIASTARTISFDANKVVPENGKASLSELLDGNAQSMTTQCERLLSLLDRLQFENSSNEGIALYIESRIQETRGVADQANIWANLRESIVSESYSGIVETEQHRLAITTQNLRMNMLNMETDLEAQFQRLTESELPGEIKDMVRTLHRLMESITFNQIAASFRAAKDNLELASAQQQLASERLSEAEELFDKIRRQVVTELDKNAPRNPNIADLNDPTLDEFLAQLEREPSIAAQLGIPNRPTNLRIRQDSMLWQQAQLGMLGASQEAAASRAQKAMKMQHEGGQEKPKEAKKPESKMTDEERKEQEESKKAQELLAKTLSEIEKQRQDAKTSEAQRERLEKMAKDIKELMEHGQQDQSAEHAWQQTVQADDAKRLMQAIAAGESLPDEQWNRLMSSLDEGLWQVRGNRPPEAYRKAIEQYQDQIRDLMQTIEE